jgi:vacuolar-type H+-ATPase subunit I/STV1
VEWVGGHHSADGVAHGSSRRDEVAATGGQHARAIIANIAGADMSQHRAPDPPALPTGDSRGTSAWVGWIAFAGFIMIVVGSFHVIQGLVAVFNDKYYVLPQSGLLVTTSYSAWGWVHIIAGVIVVAAGVCVLGGQIWARVVGTLLALVSAVLNVAFLGAAPLWSVTMIVLDVVIIMALTVHGSDIKAEA